MGIASVGHRLTILKSVYELKVNQDIPTDSDHYIPLCMLRGQCVSPQTSRLTMTSCGTKPNTRIRHQRRCAKTGKSDPEIA